MSPAVSFPSSAWPCSCARVATEDILAFRRRACRTTRSLRSKERRFTAVVRKSHPGLGAVGALVGSDLCIRVGEFPTEKAVGRATPGSMWMFPLLNERIARAYPVVSETGVPHTRKSGLRACDWLGHDGDFSFSGHGYYRPAGSALARVGSVRVLGQSVHLLGKCNSRCSPSLACWRSPSRPRYSGMDATLGLAFTRTGFLYPLFAALLGWLGVAILTGSDTSSNAAFSAVCKRITAAQLVEFRHAAA